MLLSGVVIIFNAFSFSNLGSKGFLRPVEDLSKQTLTELTGKVEDTANQAGVDMDLSKLKQEKKDAEEPCYVFIRGKHYACRADHTYVINGETIFHKSSFRKEVKRTVASKNTAPKSAATKDTRKDPNVNVNGGGMFNVQNALYAVKQIKQNVQVRNNLLKNAMDDTVYSKK